jgi:hypothetical protein
MMANPTVHSSTVRGSAARGPAEADAAHRAPVGGSAERSTVVSIGAKTSAPRPYARARMLLRRADAILGDAAGAPSAADRFLESYVAALRGAGALLDAVDPVPKRGASRSAWVRMQVAAPDFTEWAAYFSAYSALRASIEAGSADRLDEAEADEFFLQVGRFLHRVEDRVNVRSDDVAVPA